MELYVEDLVPKFQRGTVIPNKFKFYNIYIFNTLEHIYAKQVIKALRDWNIDAPLQTYGDGIYDFNISLKPGKMKNTVETPLVVIILD